MTGHQRMRPARSQETSIAKEPSCVRIDRSTTSGRWVATTTRLNRRMATRGWVTSRRPARRDGREFGGRSAGGSPKRRAGGTIRAMMRNWAIWTLAR